MVTPNVMPSTGTPVVTIRRHREFQLCSEKDCCGTDFRVEKVPALKRGPRRIRNTALADALQIAGWA